MPRGDRSSHPYRPVRRGTHGYRGVATDDAADPVRIYPGGPVVVPQGATTPLKDNAGTPVSDDGGGGGAIAVTGIEGGEVAAATALVLPGTVTEGDPGEALVAYASVLGDPGAVWQANHLYAALDRVLVDGENVWGVKEDYETGLSDATEPDWYSAFTAADNEIVWGYLGDLGEVAINTLPGGLPEFAATAPSNFTSADHAADETDVHGVADMSVLDTSANRDVAIADHDAVQGAHEGLYSGAADPSAGAGVAAPTGSLYRRGTTGTWFGKHGPADTDWRVVISASFFWMTAAGGIKMVGLPTADPVDAGQLWIDVLLGRVLKVSAG